MSELANDSLGQREQVSGSAASSSNAPNIAKEGESSTSQVNNPLNQSAQKLQLVSVKSSSNAPNTTMNVESIVTKTRRSQNSLNKISGTFQFVSESSNATPSVSNLPISTYGDKELQLTDKSLHSLIRKNIVLPVPLLPSKDSKLISIQSLPNNCYLDSQQILEHFNYRKFLKNCSLQEANLKLLLEDVKAKDELKDFLLKEIINDFPHFVEFNPRFIPLVRLTNRANFSIEFIISSQNSTEITKLLSCSNEQLELSKQIFDVLLSYCPMNHTLKLDRFKTATVEEKEKFMRFEQIIAENNLKSEISIKKFKVLQTNFTKTPNLKVKIPNMKLSEKDLIKIQNFRISLNDLEYQIMSLKRLKDRILEEEKNPLDQQVILKTMVDNMLDDYNCWPSREFIPIVRITNEGYPFIDFHLHHVNFVPENFLWYIEYNRSLYTLSMEIFNLMRKFEEQTKRNIEEKYNKKSID